jgi:hypothetical protein
LCLHDHSNEQFKILSARLLYASSTWTYQHEAEASTTVEYFPVVATVTWVPVSTDYNEFVPAPPNPFPKLPADILYPFYIPSSAPASRRLLGGEIGLLALVAATTALLLTLLR